MSNPSEKIVTELPQQFVAESLRYMDFLGSQQETLIKEGKRTRAEKAYYEHLGRTLRFVRGVTSDVLRESSRTQFSIV